MTSGFTGFWYDYDGSPVVRGIHGDGISTQPARRTVSKTGKKVVKKTFVDVGSEEESIP